MTLRSRALISLGFLGAGAALALSNLPVHLPGVCVFNRVTGIPCPTCGMTRASCALAHGDLHQALNYHIAVVPFALGVLTAVVLLLLELFTNRPFVAPVWKRSGRIVLLTTTVIVLVGWYFNLRYPWHG